MSLTPGRGRPRALDVAQRKALHQAFAKLIDQFARLWKVDTKTIRRELEPKTKETATSVAGSSRKAHEGPNALSSTEEHTAPGGV